MRFKLTTILLLAALAITDVSAAAQLDSLNLNVQPSSQLQLSVTMDRGKFGGSYVIGEKAQVFYTVNASPAVGCVYVYFFDLPASGAVHQIFPNVYSANNCVAANVQHVLPDRASYDLSIVSPAGSEVIQAVASVVPLNLNLANGQFPLLGATLDQARQRLLGAVAAANNAPIATDATAFQVLGLPFPATATPNFSLERIDLHSVRLSVFGDPRWTSAHPFQVFVQNNGFFGVVVPQAQGFAFHNGVTTTATVGGTEQLNLSGQVGAGGRVDYFITFSSTSTALRFDFRLDLNGDSFPEQVPTARIVGPLGQHPFSNPFVLTVG